MSAVFGRWRLYFGGAVLVAAIGFAADASAAEEPPKVNPFTPAPTVREDAVAGYLELSDGTILVGRIYFTREKRLKIYDEKLKRQRELPSTTIAEIDASVEKAWMERDWRFREAASDEKVYTGKTYPAREYLHTVTLQDGKTIRGPMAEIVFIQPAPDSPGEAPGEPQRFVLNKRQKGEPGSELNSLVYVRRIRFGDKAVEEGKRKAAERKR